MYLKIKTQVNTKAIKKTQTYTEKSIHGIYK